MDNQEQKPAEEKVENQAEVSANAPADADTTPENETAENADAEKMPADDEATA